MTRPRPWPLVGLLLAGLPAAAAAQGVTCRTGRATAPYTTTRTGRTHAVPRPPTGRSHVGVRVRTGRRAWVDHRPTGRTRACSPTRTGRRSWTVHRPTGRTRDCAPTPTGRSWAVVDGPIGRTRVVFSTDSGRTWQVTDPRTVERTRVRVYRGTGRRWVIRREATDTGRTRRPVRVLRHGRRAPPLSEVREVVPVEGQATGRTATPTRPARTGRTRTPRSTASREAPTDRSVGEVPEAEALALPAPVLARTLLRAVQEGDLLRACRLAAQAERDPALQAAVQEALFEELPSPQLLEATAERLRTDPRCQDAPGSGILLRLVGTPRAAPDRRAD